jgi:hypothetical protein
MVLSRENAEEALPDGFLASWACLVEIGAKIYEVGTALARSEARSYLKSRQRVLRRPWAKAASGYGIEGKAFSPLSDRLVSADVRLMSRLLDPNASLKSFVAIFVVFGFPFKIFPRFLLKIFDSLSNQAMARMVSCRSRPASMTRRAERCAGVSSPSAICASTIACNVACTVAFGTQIPARR